METDFGPPPDEPDPNAELRWITEFWNELRTHDDPGVTIWEVLEPIERQVADCLAAEPPNLVLAKSLTANAMLLRIGAVD